MPRISVKATQSEGWQPLPKGTYDIMLDGVEEGTSRNNNPQLKISGHVAQGPYEGKKVTLWYVLVANSGWKVLNLVTAAGIDFESTETDEVDQDSGKPVLDVSFDPEDLVGCLVRYDVRTYEHEGKTQNRFENEQSPPGSTAPEKPAAARATTTPTAAPARAAVRRSRVGGVQ